MVFSQNFLILDAYEASLWYVLTLGSVTGLVLVSVDLSYTGL